MPPRKTGTKLQTFRYRAVILVYWDSLDCNIMRRKGLAVFEKVLYS